MDKMHISFATSSRLTCGVSNFAASFAFDLTDDEKCDLLSLAENARKAVIQRSNFSHTFEPNGGVWANYLEDYATNLGEARDYLNEAYDYLLQSLKAPNGEASYGYLGDAYRKMRYAMLRVNGAEEALKNFMDLFGSQFKESDRKEYQGYVEEFQTAKSKLADVRDKLCSRLGNYCPK